MTKINSSMLGFLLLKEVFKITKTTSYAVFYMTSENSGTYYVSNFEIDKLISDFCAKHNYLLNINDNNVEIFLNQDGILSEVTDVGNSIDALIFVGKILQEKLKLQDLRKSKKEADEAFKHSEALRIKELRANGMRYIIVPEIGHSPNPIVDEHDDNIEFIYSRYRSDIPLVARGVFRELNKLTDEGVYYIGNNEVVTTSKVNLLA